MPTLRALECLVAVADSGSVTEAARRLHLSQPAVSHQLALLEKEVGTALFRREARGVAPTPAGRAAVVDARRAVEAAASAVTVARAVAETAGGVLRLACAQSLVSTIAPVIGEWHLLRPEVALTLWESTAANEVTGSLDAGEIDLAVVPAPVPDRFVVTGIGEEEVVLVAPADHPLAERSVIALRDLDGVALVHFATENALSGWLDEALAQVGARPRVVMRTAVTAAAPQLAAAGLGVAVCPVSAVALGTAVTTRSFEPRWTRQLVAVTPGRPDPLAARFVEDLRRHLAAQGAPGAATPPA